MMLMIALAAAAPQPSPEALALGRQIARSGTFAGMLPVIKQAQVGELIAAHPELSASEQASLRATADRVFKTGADRLMEATAQAYAEHVSVADLRVAAAYYRTQASQRMQAAMPLVIGQSMKAMGAMDFKADLAAAFCKESGKLCPPK